MAILDFEKDNSKSISLHFQSPQFGPDSQPLYFSTPESPAEHYGEAHVRFHSIVNLQGKSWEVKLTRSDPKTISPGVTRYDFTVNLDSELPPSVHGQRGWFHYRFKACIRRDFPRRDMAVKQLVWVYSSSIRANEVPQPKVYRQVFNDMMPFSCTLPSEVLYQGQSVPLTVQFDPFRSGSPLCGEKLIIMSAHVKMKQYTRLFDKKFLKKRRNEKKVVFVLPVAVNDWPQTDQGFTKTIMVDLPGARKLAASLDTEPVTKSHCLKLIMMVRTSSMSEKEAKEVRMEMDVRITSPRPEFLKDMDQQHQQLMLPPPYQSNDSDEESSGSPLSRESSTSSYHSYPRDIKSS
ncbi:hypothetical protein BGZ76_010210 [Entomortierella beljakovae]|nr:hypothetical protein BGZ76_010210 [Entomortierella beljakovae]